MDIKKLQAVVIDALEDVKASDMVLFDTSKLTSMFDRVLIASGSSNRQTKALAASVRDKVRAAGGHVVSIEGEGAGEWVLVDLGDMVVHIMQPPIRAYYQLEEIWGGKQIDLEKAKPTAKPKAAPRKKTTAQATPKATTSKKPAASAKKETATAAKPKTSRKTTAAAPSKPATSRKRTTVARPASTGKAATRKKASE